MADSMRRVTPDALGELQHSPDRIRNICILAHVDHGKTTLSDSLVSANGIISEKLAGKVRYLDNTEEEQIRGITMKSSAISLVYNDTTNATTNPYLINLVDSPGHVDFSFDVSTAVRLCDGALVLVDAVEGVCAQTHAVLRQAWQEGIRPCLVINKIDRLVQELQLSPSEGEQRLNRILEQANAVLSSFIRAAVLQHYEDQLDDPQVEEVDQQLIEDETEKMENQLLFSPAAGNVLFASAVDGWAFTLATFAQMHASKLEMPPKMLRQALWGDCYYNAKAKKVVKKPPTANSQTMFCSLVLQPLWKTYEIVSNPVKEDADAEAVRKLTKQLRIAKQVTDREIRYNDRKLATQAVLRRWLPLAPAVLKMVTRVLPSPIEAQRARIDKLCPASTLTSTSAIPIVPTANEQVETKELRSTSKVSKSIERCAMEKEDPVVVYICKLISVEANVLSDFHQRGLDASEEVYVGIGRVYSGQLRRGQPLYVLDPKFQGFSDDVDLSTLDIAKQPHITQLQSNMLHPYLLMGRDLHALDNVPAGNIVGIVGVQDHIAKTATLSSTLHCPSLTKMPYQAKPIVRVAVEPEDPHHFAELEAGLQRLYRSDPTVEVQVQESGEHVIVALGELHLERCVKDLRERFAKVGVRVSEPIVGFRESILDGPISSYQESVIFKELLKAIARTEDDEEESQVQNDETDAKVVSGTTPDGQLTLKMRALPLPKGAAKLLEDNVEVLRRLTETRKVTVVEDGEELTEEQEEEQVSEALQETLTEDFKKEFAKCLQESDVKFWQQLPLERIWSCGPRRTGPNLLVNNISTFHTSSNAFGLPQGTSEEDEKTSVLKKLENSITTGFQMVTAAGPLCNEPVWGVAFILEDVELHDVEEEEGRQLGPLSGQVISLTRTTCRLAFVKQPVRLVEALYECSVQCMSEQLGKLYSVLSKRRGEVFYEDVSDGSSLFTVKAYLPVVESFGLATDLLIQTSGAASNPQLVFSHWTVMEMDPFFQPMTEEEREDLGERVYEHNAVRKYIEAVRKRKGLARDEKIVVHAEKQRTRKK